MKRYYISFPRDSYALGPIKAGSKKEARDWARNWAGVSRLPRGFSVWEA